MEFISNTELCKIIKEYVPISEVCSALGFEVKNNIMRCPFHLEKTPSCHIHNDKNICKCYGCGEAKDQIGLWQHFKQFQYATDAAWDLVDVFKVPLPENTLRRVSSSSKTSSYKAPSERRFTNSYISKTDTFESIFNQQKAIFENDKIADDNTLHVVYSLIINNISKVNNRKLLDGLAYKYLVGSRNFSPEKCKEELYFSFPKKDKISEFMNLLINDLSTNNIPIETLKKVPGFYFDKDTNSYHMASYYNAIAIPLRNHDNKIIRIQIRLNDLAESNSKQKGSKYWYFSLPKSLESKENIEGVKAGCIAAVVFPKEITDKTSIVITEGKFKAESISEYKGCISISVQGVGNWSPAIYELSKLKSLFPEIKTIFIAYDADARANLLNNIMNHSLNLAKILEDGGFDVRHLLWKSSFGKGIDDALDSDKSSLSSKSNKCWSNKFKLIESLITLYLKDRVGDLSRFRDLVYQNDEVDDFKNLIISNFEFIEDIPTDKLLNFYNSKNSKKLSS